MRNIEAILHGISMVLLYGGLLYAIYLIGGSFNKVKTVCPNGIVVTNILGTPPFYCIPKEK